MVGENVFTYKAMQDEITLQDKHQLEMINYIICRINRKTELDKNENFLPEGKLKRKLQPNLHNFALNLFSQSKYA